MKLILFTCVYNGMPWIAAQLVTFRKLTCDWEWHIAEGAASNTHCTAWCKPQKAGQSADGTAEFIKSIAFDRITVRSKSLWDGKIEMVNSCAERAKDPGVLVEVDADEFWSPEQLDQISTMFDGNDASHAMFWCRYWFGPSVVMTTTECYGNSTNQDWRRAWRFEPGMKFVSHEPPVLDGDQAKFFSQHQTALAGLVFDHYGYATEAQVRYKEEFYGYSGAVAGWRRLQQNTTWPAKLCDFLPWITDQRCIATRA